MWQRLQKGPLILLGLIVTMSPSHGTQTNLTLFNSTLTGRRDIALGTPHKDIAMNAVTNRIYVLNGGTPRTLSVIDGQTGITIAAIPLGDANAFRVAVNPLTNQIYVTTGFTNNGFLLSIDGDTHAVTQVSADLLRPTGLALDVSTNRIFVADFVNVKVFSGETHAVLAAFNAGSNENSLELNESTRKLYIGENNVFLRRIRVFDADTFAFIASVTLDAGLPRRIRANTLMNQVYVLMNFPVINVIDGDTNSVVEVIPFGSTPTDLAVDPLANVLFVTSGGPVAVLDGATHALIDTILTGQDAKGYSVAVDSQHGRLFVAGEFTRQGTRGGCVWHLGSGPFNYDATHPEIIDGPIFSSNPKSLKETVVLTATAVDDSGVIEAGEYFVTSLGVPLAGSGSPMAVNGATLSAMIDASLVPGIYEIGVRARDQEECNWSATAKGYLVVYDPNAGSLTGAGSIVPGGVSSSFGDDLPGLDGESPARFGFSVRYAGTEDSEPKGHLEFHFPSGAYHLRSVGVEWLLMTNVNAMQFQGFATIVGLEGLHRFRVEVVDVESGADRFTLRVWPPGSDPNVGPPVHKASGNLEAGEVRVSE